ncbi:MAG: hypothetical protein H3C41_11140 [Bacteroidales bacterium]|nr:hypothetical protein [Bacteroidales bacterium]
MGKIIEYKLFDPAGNITAIVSTPVPMDDRLQIGKKMLRQMNIEQMGFISLPNNEEDLPEFQMMGGELSGNGLASAGMFLAVNKLNASKVFFMRTNCLPEPIQISFSLIRQRTEAVIKVSIIDFSYKVRTLGDWMLLDFNGISHAVIFSELEKATVKRAKDDLSFIETTNPAQGLIYSSSTREGWEIVPYISVPAVDSFICENACASGSIALALALSIKEHKISNNSVAIKQPSGKFLNVYIEKAERSFVSLGLEVPVVYIGDGVIDLD